MGAGGKQKDNMSKETEKKIKERDTFRKTLLEGRTERERGGCRG